MSNERIFAYSLIAPIVLFAVYVFRYPPGDPEPGAAPRGDAALTTISSGLKAETSGRQRIANQMSLIRIALTGSQFIGCGTMYGAGGARRCWRNPNMRRLRLPRLGPDNFGVDTHSWGHRRNLGSIDIQKDLGGRLDIFVEISRSSPRPETKFQFLGPCVSACTMAVAFIQQDHLCFGRNASLGFHLARDKDTNVPNLQWSQWMIDRYPIKIRQWIEAQGGVKQMSGSKVGISSSRTGKWAIGAAQPRQKTPGHHEGHPFVRSQRHDFNVHHSTLAASDRRLQA